MIGENRIKLGGLLVAGLVFSANGQGPVDISGTVNNSKTGAPVAGAKVWLAANPEITTTSGADGSYKLTGNWSTGIRAGAFAQSKIAFSGNRLDFSVAADNTPVSAELFNFRGEKVRTLVDMNASRGAYSVNTRASGLGGGVYFLRARVGKTSAAYRMSLVGDAGSDLLVSTQPALAALTKSAAAAVDTLKISLAGYRTQSKALTKFSGIFPINFVPGLPPGPLKIVSERSIPQVEWGQPGNVNVAVFDGFTQLKGDYATAPAEGTTSWMITFQPDQTTHGWGFMTVSEPEDMSAWKDGFMNISVRGTVSSIGVTMESYDQGSGMSTKVDLREYGYKPLTSASKPSDWVTAKIPMSKFTGTDFSQIKVYLGLSSPVDGDTEPFDSNNFYQIDDVWWSLN